MKQIKHPVWLKQHFLSISLTLIALICATGLIFWAYYSVRAQNQANLAKQQNDNQEIVKIKKIQAEKAAEARRIAAQKAKKIREHADPSNVNVIVNKKHPIKPLDYRPNLTTLSCAGYGNATVSLLMKTDFLALCKAAAAAGAPLGVTSSYRSYAEQGSTYNYWVASDGQAAADRYSARPGYSEHQTGLAIDFRIPAGAELDNFTGSLQQKWLSQNGWKYGFIQRYTTANSSETGYNAESWHYRYIGRDYAAAFIKSDALSLETFWNISGGLY